MESGSPPLPLFTLSLFFLFLFSPSTCEETIFEELREQCASFSPQFDDNAPPSPLPPLKRCYEYPPGGKRVGRLEMGGGRGEILPLSGTRAPHLHIFYRLSLRGLGNYGHSDNISPLSLMSLQRSLRGLCEGQKKTTSVYIYLNSMKREDSKKVEKWIVQHFMSLGLKNVVIDTASPAGNHGSWLYMMDMARNNVTELDDVVLQLEDDYVLVESMLQEIIEVFAVYDFCFVHPSDYPDRYTMETEINFKFGKYNVLPSTRRYWRSVESSTVTYAARMGTLNFFWKILPHPLNDYWNSKAIWERGGEWWAPMPGLCGHMQICLQEASAYVPWIAVLRRIFDDAAEKKLPFLGRNLDESFGCALHEVPPGQYFGPFEREERERREREGKSSSWFSRIVNFMKRG